LLKPYPRRAVYWQTNDVLHPLLKKVCATSFKKTNACCKSEMVFCSVSCEVVVCCESDLWYAVRFGIAVCGEWCDRLFVKSSCEMVICCDCKCPHHGSSSW
jgi:hypothetical protein